MYQFFVVALLAVAASAGPAGEATSFASFNDNHQSIQHIQSAVPHSAPQYYSAKPVVVAKVAAPTYYSPAPVASQYYSAPAAPAPQYYSAPVVKKVVVPIAKVPVYHQEPEENYGPAKYEFVYTIADPHTGDYHSQEEHRDGDHVVGQYSLHEADGTIRIVKYSDDGHGFNAVVEKQGQPRAEAPKVYKKVVAAQYPAHY